VSLSAADPLNLTGGILPGPRVPAVRGRTLVLRDGVPVDPDALDPRQLVISPAAS
ncbi:MAG: hypothetical protein JWM85_129, partial [Acidimicrobiaceae bacterium]|nr:hypothetical protein [Acidimicrobiaceae bacterium]